MSDVSDRHHARASIVQVCPLVRSETIQSSPDSESANGLFLLDRIHFKFQFQFHYKFPISHFHFHIQFQFITILLDLIMGKRNSKVKKQQKAKAKAASASSGAKFGVTAVKKGKHGIIQVQQSQSTGTNNNIHSQQASTTLKSTTLSTTTWTTVKKQQRHRRDDFDQEMKSLVERSMPRQQSAKKSKPTTTAISFTQPLLVIDNKAKPTNRLVQEAVDQIQTGMTGIGQEQSHPFPPPSPSLLEWSVSLSSRAENNPYAVLQQYEDNDLVVPEVKVFQFAPPSFVTHLNQDRIEAECDDDPDL